MTIKQHNARIASIAAEDAARNAEDLGRGPLTFPMPFTTIALTPHNLQETQVYCANWMNLSITRQNNYNLHHCLARHQHANENK